MNRSKITIAIAALSVVFMLCVSFSPSAATDPAAADRQSNVQEGVSASGNSIPEEYVNVLDMAKLLASNLDGSSETTDPGELFVSLLGGTDARTLFKDTLYNFANSAVIGGGETMKNFASGMIKAGLTPTTPKTVSIAADYEIKEGESAEFSARSTYLLNGHDCIFRSGSTLITDGNFTIDTLGRASRIVMEEGSVLRFCDSDIPIKYDTATVLNGTVTCTSESSAIIDNCYIIRNRGSVDLGDGSTVSFSGRLPEFLDMGGTFTGSPQREIDIAVDVSFNVSTATAFIFGNTDKFFSSILNEGNTIYAKLDFNIPRSGQYTSERTSLKGGVSLSFEGTGSSSSDDRAFVIEGSVSRCVGAKDLIRTYFTAGASSSETALMLTGFASKHIYIPSLFGTAGFYADVEGIRLSSDLELTEFAADIYAEYSISVNDPECTVRLSAEKNAEHRQFARAVFTNSSGPVNRFYSAEVTLDRISLSTDVEEMLRDPMGNLMRCSEDGNSADLTLISDDTAAYAHLRTADNATTIAMSGHFRIDPEPFVLAGPQFSRFLLFFDVDDGGAVISYDADGFSLTGGLSCGTDIRMSTSHSGIVELSGVRIRLDGQDGSMSATFSEDMSLKIARMRIGLQLFRNLDISVDVYDGFRVCTSGGRWYADDTFGITADTDILMSGTDSWIIIDNLRGNIAVDGEIDGAMAFVKNLGIGTDIDVGAADIRLGIPRAYAALSLEEFSFDIEDADGYGATSICGHISADICGIGSDTYLVRSMNASAELSTPVTFTEADGYTAVSGTFSTSLNSDIALMYGDLSVDISAVGTDSRIVLGGRYTGGIQSLLELVEEGTVSESDMISLTASCRGKEFAQIRLTDSVITLHCENGKSATTVTGSASADFTHSQFYGMNFDTVHIGTGSATLTAFSVPGALITGNFQNVLLPGSMLSVPEWNMVCTAYGKEVVRMDLTDGLLVNVPKAGGYQMNFTSTADAVFTGVSPDFSVAAVTQEIRINRLAGKVSTNLTIVFDGSGIDRTTKFTFFGVNADMSVGRAGFSAESLNGSMSYQTDGNTVAMKDCSLFASALGLRMSDGTVKADAKIATVTYDAHTALVKLMASKATVSGMIDSKNYALTAGTVSVLFSTSDDFNRVEFSSVEAESLGGTVYKPGIRTPVTVDIKRAAITFAADSEGVLYRLDRGSFAVTDADIEGCRFEVSDGVEVKLTRVTVAQALIRSGAEVAGDLTVRACGDTDAYLKCEGADIEVMCPDMYGGIRTDMSSGKMTVTPGIGFWLISNDYYEVDDSGTAVCKPIDGIVRIDAGRYDYTLTMNGMISIVHYHDVIELATPAAFSADVTFSGWSDGYSVYTGTYRMPARDVVLTQVWAKIISADSLTADAGGLSCATSADALNVDSDAVKIAASSLSEGQMLTLKMGRGSIAFDSEFLDSITGGLSVSMTKVTKFNSGEVADTAKDGILINLGLSDSAGEIHTFAGKTHVYIEIDSKWSASTVTFWYMDESGNRAEKIDAEVTTIDGVKYAHADLDHFSMYLVEGKAHDSGNLSDILMTYLAAVIIIVAVVAVYLIRRRSLRD